MKKGYCFKCHAKRDFVPLLWDSELAIGVYSCKECGAVFTIKESEKGTQKEKER